MAELVDAIVSGTIPGFLVEGSSPFGCTMNMNCLLVNILNSIIDTCIHSQVFANIIIIIFLTCTSYFLLLQVLSRKNILATLPNKTINLKCYFGIIFLVVLSIFYNRFAFIPTIIITCYVFLYNQIASQNSFEKNSASCRAQSIIDRLQKKIDRGDNQKSKINSGFENLNSLYVLTRPKVFDIFGTIKQTFKHEREKYDVKEQLELFVNTTGTISEYKFVNIEFFFVNFVKFDFCRILIRRRFSKCTFNGCSFIKSKLFQCNFEGCDFTNVSFYRTNLRCATFIGCKITNCIFDYANLINCQFIDCDFSDLNDKNRFKNALYNIRKTNYCATPETDWIPKEDIDNYLLSRSAQRVEMIPNCRFNSGDPFNYIDLGDGVYVCIDNDLDLQILKNYINTNNEEPILKRKEFKLYNDVDKESIYLLCFDHEKIKKLHPAWY